MGNNEKTAAKRDGIGNGTPGPGRPKGSKNKIPAALKADFIQAYELAGGRKWLAAFIEEHPVEFFRGLVRIIPRELGVTATVEHSVVLDAIERLEADEAARRKLLADRLGGEN